ncbi:hypothetical protein [Streptomyces sp. NPDC059076]|uniref:hypothetical protein n=1 Tax=unclassified Streptomyces TaxID=2593676 RepID=UPI0036B36E46
MKRITSLLTRGALASALAVGGLMAVGSPAQAATMKCSAQQHKEFPTSGFNTDVKIYVCITGLGGNEYDATVIASWSDGGGVKKFDNFDIQVRLERNNAPIVYRTCDITAQINDYSVGRSQCDSPIYITGNPSGLTGDGKVNYNLDANGAGGFTWELTGSPVY